MRVFSVPAAYRNEIEAAVRRAVDLVREDVRLRQDGCAGVVPDFMLNNEKRGEVVILVGLDADRLVSAIEHHTAKRRVS